MIIKSLNTCLWDQISLGEVMLRFDPEETRIKTTRTFKVYEGGGEYNVARALARCFNKKTSIITAFVDNEVSFLLEDLIRTGGVDTRYAIRRPFDGYGASTRIGLNFTEKGFGVRPPLGVSDRANSAASQLKVGEIDWEQIFTRDGARWFHTGGIFAALSDSTANLTVEALQAARLNGTITSYDLNYRPSLWKNHGGSKAAIELNKKILPFIDVIIGNEEDFATALGFATPRLFQGQKEDFDYYKEMLMTLSQTYPNLKTIGLSLRHAKTANTNTWTGILFFNGEIYQGKVFKDLPIFDRVGGGDSFVSGLIYGFLEKKEPSEIINYAVSHGALAMSTPGDTSMASVKEIETLINSTHTRIER